MVGDVLGGKGKEQSWAHGKGEAKLDGLPAAAGVTVDLRSDVGHLAVDPLGMFEEGRSEGSQGEVSGPPVQQRYTTLPLQLL